MNSYLNELSRLLANSLSPEEFNNVMQYYTEYFADAGIENQEEVIKELGEPKGEFVLILEGNKDVENYDDIDVIDHIKLLIEKGMRDKDAIKEVSKLHNMPKSEVYKMYLEVK